MSTFKDDNPENNEIDLEALGQLYLSSVMHEWQEAYSHFEELEYAGKREFVIGGDPDSSMDVYDDMMSSVKKALGSDQEYKVSFEETTNAFIYSANNDLSLEEFREAATGVMEKEKKWLDYASSDF